MSASEILNNVMGIVAALPPDAISAFANMLSAILSGKPDKAERLARLTAETLAIRAAGKAPFKARGK